MKEVMEDLAGYVGAGIANLVQRYNCGIDSERRI